MSQRGEYVKHHGGKDVEIEVHVIAETAMAKSVETPPESGRQLWIPKSQIVDEPSDGVMVITQWFAKKEGLK